MHTSLYGAIFIRGDCTIYVYVGKIRNIGDICMKIDIIGSVASGKTTLAKRISKNGILYYEKDNIVWKRTADGDVKRSPEERDKYFYDIIKEANWIVEGSPRKVLNESFGCCDYIIVLDEYTIIRLTRVFKHSKDAYAFVMKSYPQA